MDLTIGPARAGGRTSAGIAAVKQWLATNPGRCMVVCRDIDKTKRIYEDAGTDVSRIDFERATD